MDILVTGGAGYIGTHTCVELIRAGMQPVVVDNLSNSKAEALRRVERITGQRLTFYRVDIRDKVALKDILARYPLSAVVHFAGLKAVGESVAQPLRYDDNNVSGTVTLCEVMAEAGVKRIVFSSSATVYGEPQALPLREDSPVGATTNPYGRSKFKIEEIWRDLKRRPRVAHRPVALFQSGGCARERIDRRGPERRAEQPDALHRPGRGRP